MVYLDLLVDWESPWSGRSEIEYGKAVKMLFIEWEEGKRGAGHRFFLIC